MWKIKEIFDGDYGCEECMPNEKPKVSVTLVDENNNERYESVEDEWLIDNNLDLGSVWPDKPKTYKFWGWENANAKAVSGEYKGIETPIDLYEALSKIWCRYTCAPRMRNNWTEENMTLGQCSITAFLAQDIFGGKVYGVERSGGNFHCYNVVGDCRFDLTSEQFGDEKLDYENNPEQFREVHFAKEEKRLRYEYLKEKLSEECNRGKTWDTL